MSDPTARRRFACNLDRRGRAVRAAAGVLMLALAFVVYLSLPVERPGRIAASVAFGVVGLFALFEAGNGWCAMRALGFRTWI